MKRKGNGWFSCTLRKRPGGQKAGKPKGREAGPIFAAEGRIGPGSRPFAYHFPPASGQKSCWLFRSGFEEGFVEGFGEASSSSEKGA